MIFVLRELTCLFLSPAHSPDNHFLGFIVDKAVTNTDMKMSFNQATKENDKPIGLLYAKHAGYLNVSTRVNLLQPPSSLD